MLDIAKCQNTQCPLKEKCYRWVSEPSQPYQAYFNGDYKKKTKSCQFFWPDKEYRPAKANI